jgi:DNA-binding beta-propeller fold protein YncE/predicted flap endonuclease-1-like 5' DNA nuclease
MPIELQVGDGDTARRVDLTRFEPLGRVEIDLNDESILGSINAYVEAEAANTACPTAEHVDNGDFTDWRRTADLPALPPRLLSVAHPVERIAVSADGCVAFAAGDDTNTRASAIDVFSDSGGVELQLQIEQTNLLDIAAAPRGERAYLLVEGDGIETLVILPNDPDLMGDLVDMSGATALALAPDGTRLYVAFGAPETEFAAASTASRVGVFGTANLGATDAVVPDAVVALPDLGTPAGLAVSPDGTLVYVVMADGDSGGAVVVVDATRAATTGEIAIVPALPRRPVVSGNGTTLVLSHGPDRSLSVVGLTDLSVTRVPLTAEPAAATVSSDAAYAFVALDGAEVAIVDLERLRVRDRIDVGPEPAGIALSPDGERLYVADGSTSSFGDPRLRMHPIGTLVPDSWMVTTGRVRPACLEDLGRVAVIGTVARVGLQAGPEPLSPAALAQVVPVAGGCRYELAFLGLSTADGATAEVHWLGTGCRRAGTDVVPIDVIDFANAPRSSEPGLVAHRASFLAPEGVTQAEIRFATVAGVLAAVDRVSFAATDDVLANGRVVPDAEGALAGWVLAPPDASGVAASEIAGGMRIANSGGATAALAQRVTVEPAASYELAVDASAAASIGARPSVEVSFLSEPGEPVGTPSSLSLPVSGSGATAVRADAPASAVAAEVRLVLPAGSAIDVRALAFRPRNDIVVPLTFIAQSPGELTVTGWNVAFDVDDTPRRPPAPEGGLCAPRKPDPLPGEEDDDCSYCASCEGEHELRAPTPTQTSAGRPATATTCTNCTSTVVVPGRVVAAPVAPSAVAPSAVSVARVPTRRVRVGEPAAIGTRVLGIARRRAEDIPSLVAVNGIGERMAARLVEIGVRNVADVATASVEQLSGLRGVSPAMARDWIAQARRLRR